MAATDHFGFLALSKFAQISQTGVGAYFVTNTLNYQNQPLNFTSQRLVTKSMILNDCNPYKVCSESEQSIQRCTLCRDCSHIFVSFQTVVTVHAQYEQGKVIVVCVYIMFVDKKN